MNWYYAEGGQQVGPIDDARFRQLVLEGRIRGETLVWREGMSDWVTYEKAYAQSRSESGQPGIQSPAQPSAQAVGPDQSACVECGKVLSNSDMISYGTTRVCAACKPIFLQKLTGTILATTAHVRRPLPVDADSLISEVLARDFHLDIGSCISRGWQLVKANLGLTVGATVLVMLCNQAAGFIPLLGIIVSILLQGPLLGGLNVFYLKLIRGEQAGMADAFCGFSRKFWPLCGTFMLMLLLVYVWLAPAIAVLVPQISRIQGGHSPEFGWLFFLLAGVGFIGMMWLAIAFMFALPLCADLELGPWDALRTSFRVVSRQWFAVFGLVIVAGLLSMLGLIACIIGVFLTMPIFYAATLHAYEDIFGVRSE